MSTYVDHRPDGAPQPSKRVRAALLRRKIMGMAVGGAEAQEIATVLRDSGEKITLQRVRKILAETIELYAKQDAKDVETVRQFQLARLDKMLLSIWSKAQNGDIRAIETVLKIEAERARLTGTAKAPEGSADNHLHFHMADPAEIERMQQAWQLTMGAGADIDATAVEVMPSPDAGTLDDAHAADQMEEAP